MNDYPQTPQQIDWATTLLTSYRHYLGQDLIAPSTPHKQADQLFHAPFALVSHGTQSDPIFNYANQTALDLWEMDWPTFTQMPSRLSAEPMHRDDRAQMLAQLTHQGYVDNYQGIRISSQGRRFRIEQAALWNVTDAAGTQLGQAATFAKWVFLE
ncbi:MEKHLA domain-containing protein [Pseudanabaena sp. FACHB-2040]|uniref:MEKHLA domain-containing protein n=1 Tax=Pseudanabaena sp. FACHB-2040 TaxID=2692859 RepID=UPI001685385F|nr:MEKHLA domain-containing protein [Pseudanabaena sp. FACHB-2040]MBD2256277.1 MEKHLA domain-containing protein [Pseudanabaena sp. FACHB-2040]